MHIFRQLIREMLLAEKVYGAQAVIYHGSKSSPDVFVPALLNDTFLPGMGEGAMYGKGLYCVYDPDGTQTIAGKYGKYVYKFKVNLYGFICFDPDVAQLVYKLPLTPAEQAQELGLDESLIEKLREIRTEGLEYTSNAALPASKFLKGRVKGLIFTGSRDGRVAVVYDQTIAVPFAWKIVKNKNWVSIDTNSLKSSLRRSASGDWEAEKYEVDLDILFARLNKLPVDKRIINGNLDLIDNEKITSLPDGLQVGGNLKLGFSTKIRSLPAGLKVGGDLDLSDTWVRSLPAGLKVGGCFLLYDAKIKSLPDGLQVGGDIRLYGTKITSLPTDLQVGGIIYGFQGDNSQVPQHLKDKLQ